MNRRLATMGVALFLATAAMPATAGVTGTESTGDASVTTTTTTVQAPDVVTKTTVNVIDRYLANIVGSGKVDYSWTGGTDFNFRRESLVSRSEYAAALATLKATLENDVYSVGGRTYQYSVSDAYTGSAQVLTSSETSRTLDRSTSETTSTQSTTKSADAIIVGDSDALASAFVAQGTVSQNTDITVTNTNYMTETTTNHYDNVDYYQVNITRVISPIVLDLDGDGKIEASNGQWLPHPDKFHQQRLALFDFYGNGFPLMTEWVGPNDGLLCLPDQKGNVDGTRLFGTTTGYRDGYQALGALDANNDGRLNGAELQGLQVWQDRNGDARSEASELKSLEELGITSLNLNHRDFASSYVKNGRQMKMVDWWPNTVEVRKKDMTSR